MNIFPLSFFKSHSFYISLKLKCDRKVIWLLDVSGMHTYLELQIPCSSCVRRGVHSICPNGKMAAGQGTR